MCFWLVIFLKGMIVYAGAAREGTCSTCKEARAIFFALNKATSDPHFDRLKGKDDWILRDEWQIFFI